MSDHLTTAELIATLHGEISSLRTTVRDCGKIIKRLESRNVECSREAMRARDDVRNAIAERDAANNKAVVAMAHSDANATGYAAAQETIRVRPEPKLVAAVFGEENDPAALKRQIEAKDERITDLTQRIVSLSAAAEAGRGLVARAVENQQDAERKLAGWSKAQRTIDEMHRRAQNAEGAYQRLARLVTGWQKEARAVREWEGEVERDEWTVGVYLTKMQEAFNRVYARLLGVQLDNMPNELKSHCQPIEPAKPAPRFSIGEFVTWTNPHCGYAVQSMTWFQDGWAYELEGQGQAIFRELALAKQDPQHKRPSGMILTGPAANAVFLGRLNEHDLYYETCGQVTDVTDKAQISWYLVASSIQSHVEALRRARLRGLLTSPATAPTSPAE